MYYAQIQGQMGIGKQPWCDLVLYTKKGIYVERISFDQIYWTEKLLPKFIFYFIIIV